MIICVILSNHMNKINTYSVSLVIPVYNEEDSLQILFEKIINSMNLLKDCSGYEIIFVDDGSSDKSWNIQKELVSKHPDKVRSIRLKKNFGKATALNVGFKNTKNDIIITLDSDLQDDPNEIPKFIAEINKGYDFVSGGKKNRKDPLSKTLPSKIFNWVTRFISGVKLNDFNCGFKAYRKKIFENLDLYGELHRYIPIFAYNLGYSISEVEVNHHKRQFGYSKYGLSRFTKGFIDLITVVATTKYLNRPAHLFGGIGFFLGVFGFAILSYLFFDMIINYSDIPPPTLVRPLFFVGILFVLLSVQFFSLGIIAELLVRSNLKNDFKTFIAEDTDIKY